MFIILVAIIFFIIIFIQLTRLSNQGKRIEEQNKELVKEINSLKEKNLNQENKLNDLCISVSLQKNLNNQISIYSKKKIALLENQYSRIINSYKLLYFRKMSNLILEYLFKTYNEYFSKTDAYFIDMTKPIDKQRPFAIIGIGNNYDGILSVKKYLINFTIDYLMYVKDITSSIINISKNNYKIQIEILSQYIGKEIEQIKDKYYISSSDLINLLFDVELKENKLNEKNKDNNEKGIISVNIKNDKEKINNVSEDVLTKGITENSENGKLSIKENNIPLTNKSSQNIIEENNNKEESKEKKSTSSSPISNISNNSCNNDEKEIVVNNNDKSINDSTNDSLIKDKKKALEIKEKKKKSKNEKEILSKKNKQIIDNISNLSKNILNNDISNKIFKKEDIKIDIKRDKKGDMTINKIEDKKDCNNYDKKEKKKENIIIDKIEGKKEKKNNNIIEDKKEDKRQDKENDSK